MERYGTPVVDRRSHADLAGRLVLGVVVSAAATAAALVAAFFSAVTWSGCFLSCSERDPLRGLLLSLLAGALLACGPLVVALLFGGPAWRRAAVVVGGVGALLSAVLSSSA